MRSLTDVFAIYRRVSKVNIAATVYARCDPAFLGQLQGVVLGAREPHQEPVDAVLIASHQLRERCAVAPLRVGDAFVVLKVAEDSHVCGRVNAQTGEMFHLSACAVLHLRKSGGASSFARPVLTAAGGGA